MGGKLHRLKHTHCTYVSFLVFNWYYSCIMGFPGSSAGKESACNGETLAQFLSQEDILEKAQATHYSILGLP